MGAKRDRSAHQGRKARGKKGIRYFYHTTVQYPHKNGAAYAEVVASAGIFSFCFLICPFSFSSRADLFLVELEVKSSPHTQLQRQNRCPYHHTPHLLHDDSIIRTTGAAYRCRPARWVLYSSLTTHPHGQLFWHCFRKPRQGRTMCMCTIAASRLGYMYTTLSNMHMCYYAPYAASLEVSLVHSIRKSENISLMARPNMARSAPTTVQKHLSQHKTHNV